MLISVMFEFSLDVTHGGCNLKLILDWAWDRVVDIKDQLDQLCKNKDIIFARFVIIGYHLLGFLVVAVYLKSLKTMVLCKNFIVTLSVRD